MHSRPFSLSKPSIRRAVSLLVLVAICAAAVPIPIGIIHRPAKDSSQPFPCQHCSCGCKDAEQCWLNCCCYSPDQKLAWAKANGVTPPWYAPKTPGANKPEADDNKAARSASTCNAAITSKITLAPCQLSVITPSGDTEDLKSKLIDTGSAEKEGYWTTRYVAKQPGVYEVLHTLDTLHGKTRAIKSSKTYLVALDANAPAKFTGQENIKPHGLGLEMLLETPVAQLAAGQSIRVRLLRSGKPLSDTVVSFIPRGAVLSEGFDASFERRTDSEGRVEFVPQEGNLVLAVAHYVAEDERGEGYDKTHYGATLVLPVPQQQLGK